MSITLEQKVTRVRLRCLANIFLEGLGRVLTGAGLVILFAILCERLAALPVIQPWVVWTLVIASAALVATSCLLNRPSAMHACLLLDERLGLKERFSTVQVLKHSQDPFAVAACQESRHSAEHADIKRHFPIKPTNNWLYAFSMWTVVVAAFLFVPQKDLFGFLRSQREEETQQAQLQQAQTEIQEAITPVAAAARQLGDTALEAELAALAEVPTGQLPEVARQETIRKLGDVADRLKEMQADPSRISLDIMQQMLKQLKGSPNELARNMQLALAKGDFAKASQMLKDMQKQLEDGSLSDEQKQQLAEGLKSLSSQLAELARKSEQMESELEKQGLDKKLAQLTPEELRKALQQLSVDPKKIDELVMKAAACRSAAGRCAGLGQAMAACAGAGGLSADDLEALAGDLDKLDNFQKQAMLSQAILDQIESSCRGLGDGMCQGLGCVRPWQAGSSDRYGSGTGGPGKGYGARPGDKEGTTSTAKTRVETTSKPGPVVASWYVKDEQVKGEPLRDFTEVVQAGRDAAAEAISENRIPRKYEESIKEYFGDMERSAPTK